MDTPRPTNPEPSPRFVDRMKQAGVSAVWNQRDNAALAAEELVSEAVSGWEAECEALNGQIVRHVARVDELETALTGLGERLPAAEREGAEKLDQIQAEVEEWTKRFRPTPEAAADPLADALSVAEEAGEVCRAVLKRAHGKRPGTDWTAQKEQK